jgi:tetratricopeptide (TPR) repeat protein
MVRRLLWIFRTLDLRFTVNSYAMNGDEYFRQGLDLSRAGHWKDAVAAYKESLRLNPDNAQTYLNLGFVYYELGYDREAQEAFDKALKLQARPCTR